MRPVPQESQSGTEKLGNFLESHRSLVCNKSLKRLVLILVKRAAALDRSTSGKREAQQAKGETLFLLPRPSLFELLSEVLLTTRVDLPGLIKASGHFCYIFPLR